MLLVHWFKGELIVRNILLYRFFFQTFKLRTERDRRDRMVVGFTTTM